MKTLQKLINLVGSTPMDLHLQWIERLYQLSEQAWDDNRFAQANELSRLAEVHEREYRASHEEVAA
ncbi:MAG: hypothetical protein ACREN8_10160 [Candidatus Dormibacteraceae bacterium]